MITYEDAKELAKTLAAGALSATEKVEGAGVLVIISIPGIGSAVAGNVPPNELARFCNTINEGDFQYTGAEDVYKG